MIVPPTRRTSTLRDMDLIVRGGSRSGLGKTLRPASLWGEDPSIRNLKSKDFDQLVSDLLRAAATHGLVSEESTPFDQPGWRLNDACVLFRLGDPSTDASGSTQNAFFRDLYENVATMLRAPMHPLFGFEAREHTAQVDPDNREIREKRFRFGDREREELTAAEKRLREIGDRNPAPIDYDQVPNATYGEPEVASIGLTEQAARARGHKVRVGRFPFPVLAKAAILGAQEGFVKLVGDERYDALLGVHIIGPRATELIAEGGMALRLEATVEELFHAIHAHPTLSEAMGEAALNLHARGIHL